MSKMHLNLSGFIYTTGGSFTNKKIWNSEIWRNMEFVVYQSERIRSGMCSAWYSLWVLYGFWSIMVNDSNHSFESLKNVK